MLVASWVRELTESVMGGSPFEVGQVVYHPDGRKVKITDGRYWGQAGLSNFWYWREVLPGGELGPEECGYGWRIVK